MGSVNFFGRNWQYFVQNYLNEERIELASKSLVDFAGRERIQGKRFIDVGCGSGLFSLAAFRLGAESIMSFDIDPLAVRCCEYLKEQAGNPKNWQIRTGNILDKGFLSQLGKYDFVYAWGSLHHTGDLWRALENALDLVAERGYIYLAIYNRSECFGIHSDGRIGSSRFWVFIKRLYHILPSILQDLTDYLSIVMLFFVYLLMFKNPIEKFKTYTRDPRGMPLKIIIKDWLGGYPYEFASVDEVFKFVKARNFTLENLKANDGLLNNEYLFKKD